MTKSCVQDDNVQYYWRIACCVLLLNGRRKWPVNVSISAQKYISNPTKFTT